MSLPSYLAESIRVLELAGESWTGDLVAGALEAVTGALRAAKPSIVCGNGGSAADAIHVTGEVVGRFLTDRQALKARSMNMRTIALTGEGRGNLFGLSDYLFAVPSRCTPPIQQAHVCLFHYLCQMIEQQFMRNSSAQ